MADPIQELTAKVDALTGIVRYGHGRSFKLREETEGFSHETRLELKADIARVERKLDQFIDSQLRE